MTIEYEEIARRAFEIWQRKGAVEGDEQKHWAAAEVELRKEKLKAQKKKTIHPPRSSPLKAS